MFSVSIKSSGKSRVPAPRWMTLTFLQWDYGWYNQLWFCFGFWKAPLSHALVPLPQGQPAHRSGQGLVWPFGQQMCEQADVLPIVVLHFCGTLDLGDLQGLDSWSLLLPPPWLTYILPVSSNACLCSSWVFIGIWTVFGTTIPIVLQFIFLNLYKEGFWPLWHTHWYLLGFFQVTHAFAEHRVPYQVWYIKWDHTSAKQSLRLSHVLNLALCIQWCTTFYDNKKWQRACDWLSVCSLCPACLPPDQEIQQW